MIDEYNKKYYSKKRADNRENFYKINSTFSKKGIDTNKFFFDFILNEVEKKKYKDKEIKIVDLGTGTGYVPIILCKLTNKKIQIKAIDTSQEMLSNARDNSNDKRIEYILGDNIKLPFRNESVDIITNKLTTQFSLKEVYRVLKKDGIFVFKEYGEYKGFEEISYLFKKRYNQIKKQPSEYVKELRELGFREICFSSFSIKRTYSPNEIKNILEMANIIKDFNKKDVERIKNIKGEDGKIDITSDPFVIFSRK